MGDSQFEVVDGPSSAFEVVDGPATPKKKYPLEVDKALATIPRPPTPADLTGPPSPPPSHLVLTSPYMPGAPQRFEELGVGETPASRATTEASREGVGKAFGAGGYPKIISGVKKAIPTSTQPYPSAKEAMQGVGDIVSGAGEAATPFMAGGIATSPLRAAIGIGTGYAASKGAKAATKALGGGEDAQKLAETLGFWAPTLFGTLTGAHGEVSPEGDSAVLSGLGDRVGAGVKVGPGGVTVAGKLGPLSGSRTFGRGPAAPGIEPPTIKGQIIPPDPSGTLIAEHDIVMQRAGRVVQGQPPLTPEETPPPPPPISAHPDAPPSVKKGSLSADDVSEVAQMIAKLPPEIRTQAMQEAHGTLTNVLMEQGASGKPVVLPSGQMAMIRDQATAEKAALQVMNDSVKEHDKAQADAAKAAEPAKEPAKAVARVSSRQKAAELAAPKFEVSDSPAPKFEVVEPSGRALESGVESANDNDARDQRVDHRSSAPALAGRGQEGGSANAVVPPAPHEEATGSLEAKGASREETPTAAKGTQQGGIVSETISPAKENGGEWQAVPVGDKPFTKGHAVTFSRNLQVRKGEGKSEIIPVGTKAFIEHANAGMNFARVRLADGKVHSVPLRNLEKGSDEARGERPKAGGDISAHEVHLSRGDGAPAEGGATPPAERAGGVAGRSDQIGSSAPVAGTGEITPRVASDISNWQPPPELGAFSAPDHGATARADTERRMGGALTRSSAEVAPGKVGEMKVSDLKVAPHKFQYKLGTDAAGTSTLLKEAQKYNPELAGTISVWRDPADGKTYVVNGHHRYELAKRMGEKTVAVRHVVAKDAIAARAIGAMQNIAEGRGTALDAAKFFRDSGMTAEYLKGQGISLGEATASDGLALSRLDDSLFKRVVSGDLRVGRAKTIGEATADGAEQKAILSLVEKKEARGAKVPDDTLSELIRMVKGSEQTTETTQNLFGTQEITRSLALEKAEISAHIKQQLAKDKKLFGFVSKGDRATELERGGNKIDVDKSKEISAGAAQAEEVYNKLSERGGPISSILDESARRLADGDNAGTVKSEAYQRVRGEVSKTLGGSEAGSVGRSERTSKPPAVAEAGTRQQESPVDVAPIYETHYRGPAFDIEDIDRIRKDNKSPASLREAAQFVHEQVVDTRVPIKDAMNTFGSDELAKALGGKFDKTINAQPVSKKLGAEPTLPGMEHVPSERAEANAEQQGKDLTEKIVEPPKSIESKAGEIEQKSPLFRDTEANPQKGLFADESGSLEPGKAAIAVANAVGRVGEFLRQEIADNRRAHDLQWDMYDLDKRHEARVLRAKDLLQGLQKDGVTQDDRRAIDEHLDALEADSEHVPVPSLTPKQDEVLDKVLMPMKAEAEAAFQKVTHAGMTIPNYNPRQTKGRGGMLDRYLTPKAEQRTGKGNLLSQTMPAENRRTMMALENSAGKRMVVSLKGGQVTAWENGTPDNLGPIMNTEEGREFLDKDNNIWKLKQATKDEIEKHTNVEYYHDAAASTVVNWLQAKKAEAAHDLMEKWKAAPSFREWAVPSSEGNPPKGWRTTNLPQMKGFYVEPHMAEDFDWFNDRLKSGDPNAFDSLNAYMRIKILINPIKHPLNVGAQWAVNKGVTGFLPHRWLKIGRTGARAVNDIWNTTEAAKVALDAGAPFQSFRGASRDLVKTFYDQVGDGLEKGQPWATKLAKAVGMAPKTLAEALHGISSKIAWPVGDMMFLQSAYEYQSDHPGVELHDALREVGRTMPEYRIPTRIMDSPTLAKAMSDKTWTVFGAWHYGLLRSFSENAKAAMGGGEPAPGRTRAEEVGKGWDRLAMMALGAFVLYPMLHKLAQKLTGNKDAEVAGHGIFSYLNAAAKVAKKEETATQALTKVITPNPLTEDLASIGFNRDLKSGKHIRDDAADWGVQGSQLMRYMLEEGLPMGSELHRAHSEGTEGWKKLAWNQADVNFPKHGAAKLAAIISEGKSGTGTMTPDERERYYARQSALDGLRRGDSKAFEEGLTKGKIRPDEISSLLHRSAGSALYDKVHNFSYEETLKVYNEAIKTEDEEAQREILPLLLEKQSHLLNQGRFQEAGVQ